MDDMTRETRRAGVYTLALCAVLAGLWAVVAGCGPEGGSDDLSATPPEAVTATLQEAGDSIRVEATWPPVVFQGDTVRSWRRTFTRTDADQTFGIDDNASLTATTSESFVVLGPDPGVEATYRYCLRARNEFGTSADSTCATASFEASVDSTPPPPPDSIDLRIDTAMLGAYQADSAYLYARWEDHPDAAWYRTYTRGPSGEIVAWRNANNPVSGQLTALLKVPRQASEYTASLVIEAYGERGEYAAWPPSQPRLTRRSLEHTVPVAGECRGYGGRPLVCRDG